jgi:hypothetical protein
MRHSDYRGLEKNAQVLDEEYEGLSARSVDDHYNIPFSPNSSSDFMNDSNNRQEHSLFSFVAPKKSKAKKKNNKDNVNKVVEEDSSTLEDKPQPARGRLVSREYNDFLFDMEAEDDFSESKNKGKSYLSFLSE